MTGKNYMALAPPAWGGLSGRPAPTYWNRPRYAHNPSAGFEM